jgi:hypothetical protein
MAFLPSFYDRVRANRCFRFDKRHRRAAIERRDVPKKWRAGLFCDVFFSIELVVNGEPAA